jgi:hypothetical protein
VGAASCSFIIAQTILAPSGSTVPVLLESTMVSRYSCVLVRGRTKARFHASLYRLAEAHIGIVRRGVAQDGILTDGKNIQISLIFKGENDLARFQSDMIELMSVVCGNKRPFIGVDEAIAPHEVVLQQELVERISVDPATLSRVFHYQYEQDITEDTDGDGNSDATSVVLDLSTYVSISDPEVQLQMIEDPRSAYWLSVTPEAVYVKDKAKCRVSTDRSDPNNFLYMSHFLRCYYDGLNPKPPGFPCMKIRYVSHDAVAVPCSAIDRVVVHVVFWNAEVQPFAMVFLRKGGRVIDPLTYELELYFRDGDKAAECLIWREQHTGRAWAAAREGKTASEVAAAKQNCESGQVE